jgi:hypothetical protein
VKGLLLAWDRAPVRDWYFFNTSGIVLELFPFDFVVVSGDDGGSVYVAVDLDFAIFTVKIANDLVFTFGGLFYLIAVACDDDSTGYVTADADAAI